MLSCLVIFWMVFSKQDFRNFFSCCRILNQQNLQLCCILKIGWHESSMVLLACVTFKKKSVRSSEYDQCIERKNLSPWNTPVPAAFLLLCLCASRLMILNYSGLVACQWQKWMTFELSQFSQLLSIGFSLAIHNQHLTSYLDTLKSLDNLFKIEGCWKLGKDINMW